MSIVAIPLFGIHVRITGQSVGFFTKFSEVETDNKVEGRKELRPASLTMSEHFCSGETLKVLMVCMNLKYLLCSQ